MNWLLACVVAVVAVELFIRLPLFAVSGRILATAQKSYKTISSPHISDCWKEKATQHYSKVMFTQVAKLTLLFALIACALALLVWLGDVAAPGFARFTLTLQGGLASTALATVYWLLRRRIVSP